MKLFIKLLLLMVVLALAAPFFMKKPDGSPMLTLSALGLSALGNKVSDSLPAAQSEAVLPKTAEVYRWQDEKGVWHYSDRAQDGAAQKHQMQISQNRLKHLETQSREDEPEEKAAPVAVPERASLGDVPALLRQVDEIKKTAEQRNKTLEAQ